MNQFYIYKRSIISLKMFLAAICSSKSAAHSKCRSLRERERDMFVDILAFEGKQTERVTLHYHCKYDIKNKIMVHPDGQLSYKT